MNRLHANICEDCAGVLAPFLEELYNESLHSGSVPAVFKVA